MFGNLSIKFQNLSIISEDIYKFPKVIEKVLEVIDNFQNLSIISKSYRFFYHTWPGLKFTAQMGGKRQRLKLTSKEYAKSLQSQFSSVNPCMLHFDEFFLQNNLSVRPAN